MTLGGVRVRSARVTYPFLSEEWMTAAKGIREKYNDEIPEITAVIRINQVITDVPFGDGEVHSHLDTSSGHLTMELGLLEDADATITTDYETARALFVDADQAAAMQAFMSGKIKGPDYDKEFRKLYTQYDGTQSAIQGFNLNQFMQNY